MLIKTVAEYEEKKDISGHNYDKDMTHYYIVTYEEDINYCKDHIHYYNVWKRMHDEWGELPKHIERVDCSEREYREVFGMKVAPTRIVMEG